ncbi:DUF2255 family protein [Panacibacter sp. DH6]|uniref:DUF2255 family protein n=1 Tax=Panacibacter microcysteis TaxID=2793269 RepID=A0A931H038_9BACT|nr:DUF2255 family protein [Panacibacter microcysteis]MBG9378535.1 DUF2255 family protein [Panacibacter microcysteis]
MKKEAALAYINNNSLAGIKAGSDRHDFLDIWMVVVDDRIFARSWGFAERSWYNTFLKDPAGQIKCGDTVFSIRASVPTDNDLLTPKINSAYLAKYHAASNLTYTSAIITGRHIEKTMEFVIVED